jgi:predicted transposase YbfD/YdcC
MTLRRRLRTIQTFLAQRRDVLCFDDIRDPRKHRGRRWSLPSLLGTAVLSMMVLARSLRGAERFSQDLANGQRKLGIKRRVPDSTLGDLLAAISPAPLRQHLHRQVLAEHRRKALEPTVLPIRAISVDGKTLATLHEQANRDCQKHSPEGQPPHWLYRVARATLISSSAALCIDQMPIPADSNDCGVFAAFFKSLCKTYGRASLFELVCVDAGFASEANMRLVDQAGKAYLLSVKGNQPELQREAWRALGQKAKAQLPEAETPWEPDSSRGWIKRQLWRSDDMAHWGHWSHLRQLWLVRVVARDPRTGCERVLEDRLYATNLVRGRLAPQRILDLVRAHWRIENNCFGRLDIEWQEDHGRWVRRGNGLPVVGLLRLLAYNLLEMLHAVHLRSLTARQVAWQQLRDWVRDALLWGSSLTDAEPEAPAAAP